MTLFYPSKRMTLHVPDTGPAHDPTRGHLFFIINDPCPEGFNLLVGLSSFYEKCDRTCLLTTGHNFIRHKSFVMYASAIPVAAKIIKSNVDNGPTNYEGLVNEAEFEAIKKGFLISPHVTPSVKAYFQKNCV